jgi:hypothetical protein
MRNLYIVTRTRTRTEDFCVEATSQEAALAQFEEDESDALRVYDAYSQTAQTVRDATKREVKLFGISTPVES